MRKAHRGLSWLEVITILIAILVFYGSYLELSNPKRRKSFNEPAAIHNLAFVHVVPADCDYQYRDSEPA